MGRSSGSEFPAFCLPGKVVAPCSPVSQESGVPSVHEPFSVVGVGGNPQGCPKLSDRTTRAPLDCSHLRPHCVHSGDAMSVAVKYHTAVLAESA